MPGTKRLILRCPTLLCLSLGVLLLAAPTTSAQGLPLAPNEQQAVNNAIERGVAYLKRTQQKHGSWAKAVRMPANPLQAHQTPVTYAMGYAALPGLTLLECGVPANDPIVQQAAHFVRSKAAKIDKTYELSLCILFLDRLGDPKDKKIIQTFALRLIAGQSATGGWGYRCPPLSSQVQMELLTALRHLDPPEDMPALAQGAGKKPDELGPIVQAPDTPAMKGLAAQPASPSLSGSISRSSSGKQLPLQKPIADPPNRGRDCLGLDIVDNKSLMELDSPPKIDEQVSNSKMADAQAEPPKLTKPYVLPGRIAILPVAQNPDLLLLQDPPNNVYDPLLPTTDNSNTQFAILALWRAQQYEVPMRRSLTLIVRRYLTSQNGDGSWGYRYHFGGGETHRTLAMTCVGLIGLAVGHGMAQPRRAGPAVQDARIISGLTALSKTVGQPSEHPGKPPMENLYYLWSLQRVAVLYNLPTIGNKDWYRWGAQVLVNNQETGGNWAGGLYIGSSPAIDTCLALLFLKRANLVKDLTAKLPFTAQDLNSGIMEQSVPPPTPAELPKKTKKAILPIEPPKPMELEKPIDKPLPSPPLEETAPPSESSNSKTKWLVLSAVLFLLFSGGSLFFILLALNRRKEAEGSANGPSNRKRARGSRSPTARG